MGKMVTMAAAAVMLAWSTSVAYAGQDDDFLFKQQMYDDNGNKMYVGKSYDQQEYNYDDPVCGNFYGLKKVFMVPRGGYFKVPTLPDQISVQILGKSILPNLDQSIEQYYRSTYGNINFAISKLFNGTNVRSYSSDVNYLSIFVNTGTILEKLTYSDKFKLYFAIVTDKEEKISVYKYKFVEGGDTQGIVSTILDTLVKFDKPLTTQQTNLISALFFGQELKVYKLLRDNTLWPEASKFLQEVNKGCKLGL